jgi:ubiquinone/menaquinone biosynthesis C-methylase UbiE
MALYDQIGQSYTGTRKADPRIVDHLEHLLDLSEGAVVADIGAGTGTYTNALASRGLRLIAVEPSAVMRDQSVSHPEVAWREGTAEVIPLPDRSVDGIMSTLAVHHFRDLPKAAGEMARISRDGPVVLFTFDPLLQLDFWLYCYFPVLREEALRHYPSTEQIQEALGASGWVSVTTTEFPLPRDLRDRFTAAGWNQPESYLDPSVRANMSPLRLMPEALVVEGVSRLRKDLASGAWDAEHGHLRTLPDLRVGYVFIRASRAKNPTT